MKICILTPRFPFPENGGDVLRINHIARYLKQQGHKLILVSFSTEDANMKQAYQLYDKVYEVRHSKFMAFIYAACYALLGRPLQCGYYHSMRFQRTFNQVVDNESPQLFIGHLLRMAPYLDSNTLRSRSIIEMTDALSRTYSLSTQSSRFSPMRIVYSIENRLIRRYENYIIQRFPKTVLVSQEDIQLLRQRVDNGKLSFHTNGVAIATQPLNIYNPHKICFVGNMRTLQNQEAVLYFAEEILPLIVRQDPRTVFYIIGAQPSSRIQRLSNHKNIVVTGFVDSVEEVLADACIAVAPVHIAAGIQNKILVAMGQCIPVILTSLVSKAIPEIQDGKNAIIADERNRFADACLELMNDPDKRNQIAQEGFKMVQQHYSWSERLQDYEIIA